MADEKGGIFVAAENFIGFIGLLAILLATLGVITRFVLKISITWSDELLRTVFVWAYFIGTALLYRSSGLMKLELLEMKLKQSGRFLAYRLVVFVQNAVILVFSLTICRYVWKLMMQQISSGAHTTTSSTPAWVSPLGFFIGMCLLAVFALEKIFLRRNDP